MQEIILCDEKQCFLKLKHTFYTATRFKNTLIRRVVVWHSGVSRFQKILPKDIDCLLRCNKTIFYVVETNYF